MADVARVAGVSPQTVSNVLNERGGFTDATRRKVLAAVAQTRYRPNRAARQLRTNRTLQLGFSLEGGNLDVRNPFTLSFLREVVRFARPPGYRVLVFTHEEGDLDTYEYWARSGEIDGIVFSNTSPGDPRTTVLSALGMPFAVMGRTAPDEPQSWVDVDNRAAMAGVVDYLVAKGHQHFGYVGYQGRSHWLVDRHESARDRLAHHGLTLSRRDTVTGSYDSVRPGLDALLSSPKRPSAILTNSDSLALLVASRARATGLVVGKDVAVTGWDGGNLYAEPPLTTVRIPIAAVAEAVVSRLLREIDHGPTDEPGLILPTELVVGASA